MKWFPFPRKKSKRADDPRLEYRSIGIDQVDLIQPFWEKLKSHHVAIAGRFASDLENYYFPQRKAGLVEKSEKGEVHIDVVTLVGSGECVAYFIASITHDKFGELDSAYVEEEWQGQGIGTRLMERALAWLDEKGAVEKKLVILDANKRVVSLYKRFGFYPKTTTMVHRPNPSK